MRKKVTITFDNWDELDSYAKEKGLTNVANLARFCIAGYMTRYPQKKRNSASRTDAETHDHTRETTRGVHPYASEDENRRGEQNSPSG